MSDKNKRFSEIEKMPLFCRQDYRHQLSENGELSFFSKLPKKQRKILEAQGKKISHQYSKILKKIHISGAGFPTDQLLRQMAIEYTHRYASSGTNNQPVSFNYFEPFCQIKLIQNSFAPYMELAKEYDHLFYSTDFFDYLTSPASDDFDLKSLYELPDEKIFHFSINGDVADFSVLNAENREFLISGFSLIRHENTLYWYLIGGEVLGEEEWNLRCSKQTEIDLEKISPSKLAFLRDSIKESNCLRGAPLPLEGTKTAIRTIISGEMDLDTKKHVSRCYMTEYENSFPVICDDPEILIGINDDNEKQKIITNMMEHFDKTAVLWNLAESFFQLPNYFSYRIALKKELLVKAGKRLTRKKGGRGVNKQYQIVSAIEVTDITPTSTVLKVNLPHYEIETEGYWRRLPVNSVGRDRNGCEVQGKTWVKSSNEWRAAKKHSKTVYVKDSISSAKLTINEYLRAADEIDGETKPIDKSNHNYGELYVMRCSVMNETIFKVGYTEGNSNDRAKQLSSATGVPLSFFVVKSWPHNDAKALETEVHMMLAPYRINNRREFFKAQYSVISNIIETAIVRNT